jgi:hypothetical protein
MSVDNNSTAGETATSNPGGETSTNLGGGFENGKAILATIQDELIRFGSQDDNAGNQPIQPPDQIFGTGYQATTGEEDNHP